MPDPNNAQAAYDVSSRLLVTIMSRSSRPIPFARRLQQQPIGPDPSLLSPSDVNALRDTAVEQYERSLEVDLHDPSISFINDLQQCSTTDEILDILSSAATCLGNKHRGGRVGRSLREVIKPVVHGLSVIFNATAETVSSIVRVYCRFT